MSVDFLTEDRSSLELLPSVPFRKIIKMIELHDLKALRIASKTLRSQIDEEISLFKHWILDLEENDEKERYSYKITDSEELMRFSSDVQIIEGLKLCLSSPESKEWQPCFQQIFEAHPELKDLHLGLQVIPSIQTLAVCLPTIGQSLTKLDVGFCHSLEGLEQLDSGSFPVLEHLAFGGNLTNEEAACLLGLVKTTLKKVRLCQMLITENFLPEDCIFSNLEEVQIFQCYKITIKGLSQLLQSATIKGLQISNSICGKDYLKLRNYYFGAFEKFDNSFRVSDNWIIEMIRNCPQLKVLNVYGADFTGEPFSDIRLNYTPQLVDLDLSSCWELTDDGLIHILKKVGSNLKVLNVENNNITGESFAHCTFSFPLQIESLILNNCKNLSDIGFFSIIDKLGSQLRILTASNTNISGESFIHELSFQSITSLESLDLDNCSNLTDLGITAMLSKVGKKLRVLGLRNSKITGKSFVDLAVNSVPVLEELDLSECSKISDARLKLILEKCGSRLKVLKLSDTNISGVNFQNISVELPCLVELQLLDCRRLTDTGIVAILNKLGKNLKILYLGSINISGENFDDIWWEYSSLEVLDLHECHELSIEGLTLILERFGGNLRSFSMYAADITEDMFYEECAHFCPMLRNFTIIEY